MKVLTESTLLCMRGIVDIRVLREWGTWSAPLGKVPGVYPSYKKVSLQRTPQVFTYSLPWSLENLYSSAFDLLSLSRVLSEVPLALHSSDRMLKNVPQIKMLWQDPKDDRQRFQSAALDTSVSFWIRTVQSTMVATLGVSLFYGSIGFPEPHSTKYNCYRIFGEYSHIKFFISVQVSSNAAT